MIKQFTEFYGILFCKSLIINKTDPVDIVEVVDSSSTTPTIFFKDNSLVTNKLRGFFFAAILSSKLHQNAPKCPVFDTRLRNFTERILTSTLGKILLPHASICTIKQKLRNFATHVYYHAKPYTGHTGGCNFPLISIRGFFIFPPDVSIPQHCRNTQYTAAA